MALIAADSGLLQPLREFVKVSRRPTWGTCAGMILLAEKANRTKKGGQELVGGLDIKVERNAFGRQRESFVTDLSLPWINGVSEDGPIPDPFKAVFIRAPVVETVLPVAELQKDNGGNGDQKSNRTREAPINDEGEVVEAPSLKPRSKIEEQVMAGRWDVKVLAELPARQEGEQKRIVAVQQGNVVGTSFHPELTGDWRMHRWWLMAVIEDLRRREKAAEELGAEEVVVE